MKNCLFSLKVRLKKKKKNFYERELHTNAKNMR